MGQLLFKYEIKTPKNKGNLNEHLFFSEMELKQLLVIMPTDIPKTLANNKHFQDT
jgi:hypothetical protein